MGGKARRASRSIQRAVRRAGREEGSSQNPARVHSIYVLAVLDVTPFVHTRIPRTWRRSYPKRATGAKTRSARGGTSSRRVFTVPRVVTSVARARVASEWHACLLRRLGGGRLSASDASGFEVGFAVSVSTLAPSFRRPPRDGELEASTPPRPRASPGPPRVRARDVRVPPPSLCRRRCYYCDFAVSVVGDNVEGDAVRRGMERYVDQLCREIERTPSRPPLAAPPPSPALPGAPHSLFGGGTPSLVPPTSSRASSPRSTTASGSTPTPRSPWRWTPERSTATRSTRTLPSA